MKDTEPDLSRSALLVMDVQRDFALPGAPAEIPGTMAVVPRIERLLHAFREAGKPIVHIVRLYLSDGSNADLCRREWLRSGQEIVCPGSAGAQPVEGLLPEAAGDLDCPLLLRGGIQSAGGNETIIYKPRWGAFFGTPLQEHLENLQVHTLVVCGCNYPNCPRTTIYEASERDYRLVLVTDAISGIYQRGEDELRAIGVRLWPAATVIDRLAAGGAS